MTARRFGPPLLACTMAALVSLGGTFAQDKKADEKKEDKKKDDKKKDPPKPPVPPTAENVEYGPHPRNVLDFFQAKSDKPTPLVFFIHGGGWRNGDKSTAA